MPGAGEGIGITNTVASTSLDFVNLDSDGDGLSDNAESGLTLSATDSDGDGLDNAVDTSNSTLPFTPLPMTGVNSLSTALKWWIMTERTGFVKEVEALR